MSRTRFAGLSTDELVVVCAARTEAFVADGLRVHVLGVGKVAAALSLPAAAASVARARAVLLFGVAGAFPDRHRRTPAPVRHGQVCVVGDDRFGDEGVATPEGFVDLVALGLGETGPFAADAELTRAAAQQLGVPVVRGTTVSTCSGTEATSRAMAERSGADVETMEGAAIALACRQLGLPLLHVRAVSNWTGDRDRGQWDLQGAVAAVQAAVRRLCGGA